MTLHEAHHNISKGIKVNSIEVLAILVDVYEQSLDFLDSLHNNTELVRFISEDLMKIGNYMPTLGMAKSVAETLLENQLSITDENWRKTNLADYKQSSKSSTTHQINLRGNNEIMSYSLISKSLISLYFDMNTKFKCLQTIGANYKFEIENGLASHTINESPNTEN